MAIADHWRFKIVNLPCVSPQYRLALDDAAPAGVTHLTGVAFDPVVGLPILGRFAPRRSSG